MALGLPRARRPRASAFPWPTWLFACAAAAWLAVALLPRCATALNAADLAAMQAIGAYWCAPRPSRVIVLPPPRLLGEYPHTAAGPEIVIWRKCRPSGPTGAPSDLGDGGRVERPIAGHPP